MAGLILVPTMYLSVMSFRDWVAAVSAVGARDIADSQRLPF